MKNILLCLSIVVLTLSGCSIFKSEQSLMANEGSGSFLEEPSNNKSVEKLGVTSCSCPGFSYTTGTGVLTRSHHASQCSASCPSPKHASCSCRVTSYSVAGTFYNSCGCR